MMNININIIQPTINVVSSLHPYLSILRAIYEAYAQVSENKAKCRSVVERAERVLGAISEELSKVDDSVREEESMKRNFYTLDHHFTHIREMMVRLSKMNFLKALLRQDEIIQSLNDAHIRLTDCLQCFQISTQFALRGFQNEYEVARQADASLLQKKLQDLEQNDSAMVEALQVNRGEMMEAMLAMQTNITHHVANTVESRILKHALSTLQRVSGRAFNGAPPPWVISTFDIEIDDGSPLGEGGFGSVKRGTWNGLAVAVKVMTKETSQEALLREVQIWQHLRHDHVLPFYGASVTSTPPFIVSRLLENGNAINYLRKHPGANRVKMMHQVALGMTYLHHSNIIHGDLKGVNILIDDSGKAVVCDFGLSRVKQRAISRAPTSLAAAQSGTLRFMSPEQMMGRVEKPADVYSYAMLLYEIFTGDVPFYTLPDATFFILVAQQHTRLSRPTSEKIIARGLSDEMWALLWDCSDPEAEYRPNFDAVRMRTEAMAKWFEPAVEADPVGEDDEITDLFAALYTSTSPGNHEAESTTFLPYLARTDVRPILPPVNPKHPPKYAPLSAAPTHVNGDDDGPPRWRQAQMVKHLRAQVAAQERYFEAQMSKGPRERHRTEDEYWRTSYRDQIQTRSRDYTEIAKLVESALGDKAPDRFIFPTIVPYWVTDLTQYWPDSEVCLLACCWDAIFQKLPGSGYDSVNCYKPSDPALTPGSFDVSWLTMWSMHEKRDSIDVHASLLRSGGILVATSTDSQNEERMERDLALLNDHGAFRDIRTAVHKLYILAVRR